MISEKLREFNDLRAEIFQKIDKIDIELLNAMSFDSVATSETNEITQRLQQEVINKVMIEREVQEELEQKVNKALKMLGLLYCIEDKYRQAIILVVFEGLSYREAGERMTPRVSKNTVKRYLAKGKEQLFQKNFHKL